MWSDAQGRLEAILGTVVCTISVEQNAKGQLNVGIDHALCML